MIQVKYSHKIVIKIVSTYVFKIGFCILFLLAGVFIHPVIAQNISNWAPQQRIPGYENDASNLVLLTDQNRTVHAFSSQWLSKDDHNNVSAIMYNRWTLYQGWTKPIDILMSPLKNDARLLDVILDSAGMLHLIFWGGDNVAANIYYSSAPISQAENAQAWSIPILVGENAQDPESGLFYIDDQNNFVILFAGKLNGNGLYEASSTDQGVTWSKPLLLSSIHKNGNSIFNLKISIGDGGWIHVIWIEYNAVGQGRGIYYINFRNSDARWGEVIKLAEAESGLGTMTPTIIEYKGSIFAIYNMTPEVTMRRSDDEGKTWGNPTILFPRFVGVNGSLSMVIDENNKLHLFFGQRVSGNPDIHGMWHSLWENGYWSQPDPVVSGPLIVDKIGDKAFDPYDAQAVVSQGNTILVTWHTDYASKQNGIWYSYATLNPPELATTPIPISNFNASPTIKPILITPGLIPTFDPTLTPSIISSNLKNSQNFMDPWAIYALISAFVILLVLSILLGLSIKRNRS